MSEEQLVSLEEAMGQLQINREQLKELFRKNTLRYVLEDGKIKIPKMALMALKIQVMTSTTRQFSRIKRSSKQTAPKDAVEAPKLITIDAALEILKISRSKLDELIGANAIRHVENEGECRLYLTSVRACQLQLSRHLSTLLVKTKPAVKRVY